MTIGQDKLKTQYQGLADDLRRLEGLENEFAPSALKVVRWFADFISDADKSRGEFDLEIQKAREELQGAQRQLQSGNLDAASFSLDRANRMLNRASRLWRNYLKGTIEGAESLEDKLTPVRTGCLVAAGIFFGAYYGLPLLGLETGLGEAGAWATAGGLHVGGLTYLSHLKDAPQHLSSQVPFWAISWRGDSEENKNELTQLATETQGLLKAWYKDHSTSIPHGELYTRWEVATHPDPLVRLKKESLLQKWKEDEADYKAVVSANAPFEVQVSGLMDHLYEGEVGHYEPNYALLIDQAQGLGGNCEAQTKRVIAALMAAIRFPKDRVPGLQPIKYPIPHLQPVIATLDENHKVVEIWDLVNDPHGKNKTKRVEGPIYHAALLLHGHLLGQGLPSPLKDKDFLIQEADFLPSWASVAYFLTPYWLRDPSLVPPRTDSQLVLPQGEGYNPGSLEEGREENPGLTASSSEKADSPRSSGEDLRSDVDKAFQAYYDQLPTEEEKWSFLFDVYQKRLHQHLDMVLLQGSLSSKFLLAKEFFAITSDPKNLKNYSEMEFAGIYDFVSLIRADWVNLVYNTAHRPYFQQKFPNMGEGEAEKILFNLLQKRDPQMAEVLEAGQKFSGRVKDHPEEFLPILDELSSSKRQATFLLLSSDFPMTGKANIRSLFNLVADPSRVMIGDRIPSLQKQPTPEEVKKEMTVRVETEPDPGSEAFIEVELLDEPKREVKESEEAILTQSAALTISPEFFLDILSYARGPELSKRWTPSFSHTFLKLNREGQYDKLFSSIYREIVESRRKDPKQVFTKGAGDVPNPLIQKRTPYNPDTTPTWVPADLEMILKDILRRDPEMMVVHGEAVPHPNSTRTRNEEVSTH